MTQGVYSIRHIATGRCYVGSSVNIERRWNEHKRRIKNNTHPAKHLANAVNLYGIDAFEFVLLEECDIRNEQTRYDREMHWITELGPVFNVAPVAGSILGLKRSDEVRARMSAAQKGRPSKLKGVPRSEEARKAISAGKKGKRFTKEHISSMVAALKGRVSPRKGVTLSEETKRRISASKSGVKQSPEAVAARMLANTGKKRTEEQRQRISAALLGKPLSQEHRDKLSEAAKARRARERAVTSAGQYPFATTALSGEIHESLSM